MPSGRQLAHVVEGAERLFDLSSRDQGPGQRAERVAVPVPIAHRAEQVRRLLGGLERGDGPSGPQPQGGDEDEHHADRPAVAALARLAEDLFGQALRFEESALVVAHPREQPERPAESAGVADVGERRRRLLQPGVGPVGSSLAERQPGEVLQRPCLSAAISGGLVELERVAERGLCGDVLVLEHQRHAERAEAIGGTLTVAQRAEPVDGGLEAGDRRRQVAELLFEVTAHEQHPRPAVVAVGALHRGGGVALGGFEVAQLDTGACSRKQEVQAALARDLVAEVERLGRELDGDHVQLAALGLLHRPAQPMVGPLDEIDAPQRGARSGMVLQVVDGTDVADQRGRDRVVVRDDVDVGGAVHVVELHPLGDAVVTPHAVGLREHAVGHLAHEVGPERPSPVVDHDQVLRDKPRDRVGDVRDAMRLARHDLERFDCASATHD